MAERRKRKKRKRFPKVRNRVRVKGISTGQKVGGVTDIYGNYYPSSPIPYRSAKGYSRLTDEVGIPGWNECDHIRMQCTATVQNFSCPSTDNNYSWIPSVDAQLDLIDKCDTESLAAPSFADWLSSTPAQFGLQFDNAMSLANSLYELKNGVGEWLPTMEDLKQSAAGNYLKLKFGIEPFIKDIKDMFTVWGKFRDRYEHLYRTRGISYMDRKKKESEASGSMLDTVNTEYGFVYSADPFYLPKPPALQPTFIPHPFGCRYQAELIKSKGIYHALITNELIDMDNLLGQADAFGRVLGLSNLPKILYNAYPWTWLADWFIDTDDIFDQIDLTDQPFEGQLILRGLWLTTKVSTFGRCEAWCDESESNKQNAGSFHSVHYVRSGNIEGATLGSSLIQPSLNGDQNSIGLALLLQKSRAIPDWEQIYHDVSGRGRRK